MENLKYFNDYWNPIIESFNSPMDINWVINTDSELNGEFTVNNNNYLIESYKDENNVWNYKFYYHNENNEKSTELTNINIDRFKVLSTIRKGMKYILDEKSPSGIVIFSFNDSNGRINIYRYFCLEIKKEYGYEFFESEVISGYAFILYKGIPFKVANNSFSKMIGGMGF